MRVLGLKKDTIEPVRHAFEYLTTQKELIKAKEELARNRWHRKLFRFIQRYPWISVIAIVELGLLITWLLLLCCAPRTLLIINERLDTLFNEDMRIKYGALEGSAPIKLLLLVGLFHYHRRVLDAWVDKHIDTVRRNFKRKKTVADRRTHVPIPVVLDGKIPQIIQSTDLRKICQRNCWRVLILGEGGAGKTSLACQLAHWAMDDDTANRLCKHRMLPTLIEYELTGDSSKHMFENAIRGQLMDLLGGAVKLSPDLLRQLLRKQRVMVIVDHLSEMSEATRQAVRPSDPEFLPNALVVTSRMDETFDGVRKTTINPRRVDGNRLSSFLDSYLTQIGKRELFDDEEFFDMCRKLSRLVAERDITVLLAKLYADQMVSVEEGGEDSTQPDNILDLMLQYLKILNRIRSQDEPDNPEVQKVAKIAAWECLRGTYRPGTALREDILNSFSDTTNANEVLKHLESRLRVIRIAGVSDDKILFELDPLAEYLAALHVVGLHRDSDQAWRQFLSQADAQSGAPEAIRGFLLAIRDCCVVMDKNEGWIVPNFVLEQIDRRTGLNPEVLRKSQLNQRILQYINTLNLPEPEDRITALNTLGQIGPDATTVVPALIKALEDDDSEVRKRAAWAIGQIGPGAKDAVPALIEAFRDENTVVRWNAVEALKHIGAEAVPTLIETLKGDNATVRWYTVEALEQIGPGAKDAVVTLMEALNNRNEDERVRFSAVRALGKIGPGAKDAVVTLIDALNNRNGDERVRWSAGWALGQIGPDARDAVPSLIEAFSDEGKCNYRWTITEALGKIGLDAVPALIEALKDDGERVRWNAAEALGYVGPDAKEAVLPLIEALMDDNKNVQRNAAKALVEIGPVAIPTLCEALNDDRARTQAHIAKIIKVIKKIKKMIKKAVKVE